MRRRGGGVRVRGGGVGERGGGMRVRGRGVGVRGRGGLGTLPCADQVELVWCEDI